MATEKTEKIRETRSFNIRKFPEDLFWRLKTSAFHRHLTVRDFLIQELGKIAERCEKEEDSEKKRK